MTETRWFHDVGGRARDGSLRASDGDREAVVERLRQEHLQGRLDDEELQERIARALAAKTYADLDTLVEDLPRVSAPTSPRRPTAWGWTPLVLLPLLAGLIALSGGHRVWLLIPAFFLVVRPLVWRRGWGGRVPGGWSCVARRSAGPHDWI